MVYLHSDEHDATDKFCKETLADSELLSYLVVNEMIVWGGNVKETEGFQGKIATLNVWIYQTFSC